MGKLFVIEGTDGSGKSTQFNMTREKLEKLGKEYRSVVFPRYKEASSALLRMYLNGDFGKDPKAVNPYAASTFFAVDRYASFQTDWRGDYERGATILCDRYTTSNAIHQASKLPHNEAEAFTKWLFDYEYGLLGLPEPSCVFFLDVPPEYTFELLKKRQGESGDIHELDKEYLKHCRETANELCDRLSWKRIECVSNGVLRTPEEINGDIMKIILQE
ncbi:MAG: deoxynucleoside kinase [Clostridia bacterium]|nr:deoxynucleoside kinase [Clostridia bacterium]